MMFKLNGVVLTLTSTVSTIIQRLQALIHLGVSNTSVPTVIGKHKLMDAQERLQVAQSKLKRKPKVALADTTEQSRKQTQNPVLAVLGQGGLQREIRASQPVSKSRKRKPSTAQYTIAETSSKPILKPVLKINGKDGLLLATLVSKTPQRAKAAPTKKAKVAVSTTQGKKRTQGKTPAQTPTVRQRKVRGT